MTNTNSKQPNKTKSRSLYFSEPWLFSSESLTGTTSYPKANQKTCGIQFPHSYNFSIKKFTTGCSLFSYPGVSSFGSEAGKLQGNACQKCSGNSGGSQKSKFFSKQMPQVPKS